MPFTHRFKPTHKEINRYYEELAGYSTHEVTHEGATSTAFQNLLATTAKRVDWHLVPQLSTTVRRKQVRPDGTLRDEFNLHRGYWEAKDFAGDCVQFAHFRKSVDATDAAKHRSVIIVGVSDRNEFSLLAFVLAEDFREIAT